MWQKNTTPWALKLLFPAGTMEAIITQLLIIAPYHTRHRPQWCRRVSRNGLCDDQLLFQISTAAPVNSQPFNGDGWANIYWLSHSMRIMAGADMRCLGLLMNLHYSHEMCLNELKLRQKIFKVNRNYNKLYCCPDLIVSGFLYRTILFQPYMAHRHENTYKVLQL